MYNIRKELMIQEDKEMKKLLVVLLALALAFSMTACGGDEDVLGQITGEETESNGAEESQDTAETETPVSLGKAEGTVYESEFLGMGFNLPEGWNFYTDEQIKELNNLTSDMVDDDVAKQLAEASLIHDMYAMDSLGSSTTIILEKMSAISSAIVDEKTYAESSVRQIPKALESLGFTEVKTTIGSTDLCGEEHVTIDIEATSPNGVLYEKVICVKIGQYIACITVATLDGTETAAILSNFYSLD